MYFSLAYIASMSISILHLQWKLPFINVFILAMKASKIAILEIKQV